MVFFLGTHEPSWLGRTTKPLFISRTRMARRKRLPRAKADWALDSGAFTELRTNGRFSTPAKQYADEAVRYQAEVGRLRWAAIQDWLVDEDSLRATGKSMKAHQVRSVESYLELTSLAPQVVWIPILHGCEPADFYAHAELYQSAKVRLWALPTIGIGSICLRQADESIAAMIRQLARDGLPLHAFGMKVAGLRINSPHLVSADSMAWSYQARRRSPLAGCSHVTCSNCFQYATRWRRSVGRIIKQSQHAT